MVSAPAALKRHPSRLSHCTRGGDDDATEESSQARCLMNSRYRTSHNR